MVYWKKLQDPRWQRRRLEILAKSNFICEDCGSHEKTLHVHHGYYRKGADPWDYDDPDLHCLCKECHTNRHEIEANIKFHLAFLKTRHLEMLDDVLSDPDFMVCALHKVKDSEFLQQCVREHWEEEYARRNEKDHEPTL